MVRKTEGRGEGQREECGGSENLHPRRSLHVWVKNTMACWEKNATGF